jgi:hypothetical protein
MALQKQILRDKATWISTRTLKFYLNEIFLTNAGRFHSAGTVLFSCSSTSSYSNPALGMAVTGDEDAEDPELERMKAEIEVVRAEKERVRQLQALEERERELSRKIVNRELSRGREAHPRGRTAFYEICTCFLSIFRWIMRYRMNIPCY